MSARVLVIGVDALSPVLVERWAAEGKLPAIRGLMARGTHGLVESSPGFFVGSTWPSWYTGLNPAGHGLHYLVQLRPGTYDFMRPMEEVDGVGGIPFWSAASAAGRRVAVLDVPLSRLDPGLNGIQLVEWGGHDAVFGFQASSPEVAAAVAAAVGPYPMPSTCDGDRSTAADYESFLAGLEQAIELRTRLTLDLLDRERWDLFVQVFTEGHCAGHQCWHLHDPSHPAYQPEIRALVGDPLERVYRALDRALAAILERAGDATVLVLSAHGMGSWRGGQFLLPEILFRLGASVPPVPAPPGPRAMVVEVARRAWMALPSAIRGQLRPLRSILTRRRNGRGGGPRLAADPRYSRCFVVPNGAPVGGIRLNLKGREPAGLLEPGREAGDFCENLARDLLQIMDQRTGRPLIRAVHRTETLHSGDRLQLLPDLLVEWSGDVPTGSKYLAAGRGAEVVACSAGIGEVRGVNDYGRSGEHLPAGFFVAAGRGIAAGRGRSVSVTDFYPTICQLLDVPAPPSDGKLIPEIVAGGR